LAPAPGGMTMDSFRHWRSFTAALLLFCSCPANVVRLPYLDTTTSLPHAEPQEN
jgi:hypothetical protein